MDEKIKQRNLMWDNYKGILIFLVVFAHFLYAYSTKYSGTLIDKIVTIIYLFHMPAFVLCSGFFSKSDNASSKKSILKLLLMYFIFNSSMMIFLYIYKGTKLSFLSPYNSYWYIFSLIFWRLSIKHLSKIKFIIPISIIIALLVGFHSEFSNILSIRRTITFFPFFLIGYKLANSGVLEKYNSISISKNTIVKAISLILLVTFITLLYYIVSKYNFTSKIFLMGAYNKNTDIFFRIAIFIISFIMILLLYLAMPNKKIIFITKVGKNSLGIYVTHRFFTYIFLLFFKTSNYTNYLILYSFVATIIIMIIFGSDFFNTYLNNIFNSLALNIIEENKKGKIIQAIAIILLIIMLLFNPISSLVKNFKKIEGKSKKMSLNINGYTIK